MNKKTEKYVAPEVVVIECQVEKGYATTDGTSTIGIGTEMETGSTKTTNWWFDTDE